VREFVHKVNERDIYCTVYTRVSVFYQAKDGCAAAPLSNFWLNSHHQQQQTADISQSAASCNEKIYIFITAASQQHLQTAGRE
jgi:hypothetical protein